MGLFAIICQIAFGPLVISNSSGSSMEMDREILVNLYRSTNGDSWSCRDGWLNNTLNLGRWFGVRTNDEGRVVELNLNRNNLRGKLPEKSVAYK